MSDRKNNSAIKVDKVTVSYRSYSERPTSLKASLLEYLRSGKTTYYKSFDALKGVDFEVRWGSIFGIIGSNGSGKSTLLKTIMGVLPPREGMVVRGGSIDSLIQLGTGFDPELNAIENIYLNASLYKEGRKEVEPRVERIIEFAELQDFVNTPIKYFSSGMYARLGFSVAIDRKPDILLVDEVLAVGDERFQQKCYKVFEDFISSGKTIVMVSHSMDLIRSMCDDVILLSKGEITFRGKAHEAVDAYLSENYNPTLQK